MAFVDDFLNKITMYRLVLYYLLTLLGLSFLFGIFDILPYSPADLAFSTLVALGACWVTNAVFARVFGAMPNTESVYITGLILALIITPVAPSDMNGVGFIVFASIWAMAVKFVFAIGKRHLFNPAAFGVALGALVLAGQGATWWAGGCLPLLPFVAIGGLMIVRKTRRFDMVIAFLVTALITIALTADTGVAHALSQTFLRSAIFFLAFVMLTEPLTMPPSRTLRIVYGAMVGLLFAPNMHIGSFSFSPELALLAGNLFAYLASPKGRFILTLVKKERLADHVYEFSFSSDQPVLYRSGQYAEWTLPHRSPDNRGNRRYFTIASAPTEDVLRLGVKFYEPSSSFKRALGALKEGATLSISHVAGDFTLPRSRHQKLAFIAGGIGVTPFRSMVQYLVDTNDSRPLTLLYANKTAAEIAYKDLFDAAAQTIGMKTIYAITDEPAPPPGMVAGKIDVALIAREIPDYRERLFYIAGPQGMVESYTKLLTGMGVPARAILSDYFPGFA